MLTVSQVQDIILQHAQLFETQEVAINDAYGLALAEDIQADRDYPPFHRAAMDGYAVRSKDILRGLRRFRILEDLFAGSVATQHITQGTSIKIMTGAPVPEGADMVIPREYASQNGSTVSFLNLGELHLTPWLNIAQQGEDALSGTTLVHKGNICTPAVISILAVTGNPIVKVYKLPTVAIISTGDEIIPIDQHVLPHQIRDSNSYALHAYFNQYQLAPIYKFLIQDDRAALQRAVDKVLDFDIIITSGGVSMGDADFVPDVMMSLGVKRVFHKVQLKPGKPLWFGKTDRGGAVFGLPGNPMSVQVAFKLFIEPYLRKSLGLAKSQSMYLPLLAPKPKATRFEQYFPCKIATQNGQTGLLPLAFNGSGDIKSTLGSEGIAQHPADAGDLEMGVLVEFLTWKTL